MRVVILFFVTKKVVTLPKKIMTEKEYRQIALTRRRNEAVIFSGHGIIRLAENMIAIFFGHENPNNSGEIAIFEPI